MKNIRFLLSIMLMLLLTSCGKQSSSEVTFVLPDVDTNVEFQNPTKEELITEETIEKYDEAEQFFNGVLPSGYSGSTIHGGGHDWSIRLKCPGYHTLAGMDAYWRQYFTQQLYDEEYGSTRENAFFEYDGDLCMQGISGFPDRIIFDSVSDWVETDEGIEACFNMSKNRCTEFINDEEHFDRVRVTFVWENDILKIDKILDLEKAPQ